MKSISVEKQNKISEILLSSTHSRDIIFGKVISGYVLALIQIILWIVITGCLATAFFGNSAVMSTDLLVNLNTDIPIPTMEEAISFGALFFICITGGYLVYSSLFAIIGSISSPNTNTQQYSFILTIPLILVFIYANAHIEQGDMLMTVMTYLPITSPIALVARYFSDICFTEIVFSLMILYFCVYLCLNISAVLYRHGITAESDKAMLKFICKWLKLHSQ